MSEGYTIENHLVPEFASLVPSIMYSPSSSRGYPSGSGAPPSGSRYATMPDRIQTSFPVCSSFVVLLVRNLTNSTSSILATTGLGRSTSGRHPARNHQTAPGDVKSLECTTSERAASQRRLRPGRDYVQRDCHSLRVHRDRPEVRSSFCATAPCATAIESRPVCPDTKAWFHDTMMLI